MKKLGLLFVATFALAVSCEKPMSEADRNAQVEQEVQRRLEAEHQAQERERLAQQQADLDARERALSEKEAAAARATATPRAITRTVVREEPRLSERGRPRSYDTFYRKLEPYGSWRETGDYGYVWQPRVAQQSRNWRPYTDGRWAYTDAGWTWVSDEPFGWAAYHYGRWVRLRGVGWVWVPGEEWAPAWVSWRTSGQYVGWAPLPPEARFERRTGIKRWADSYYDIGADEYVFIPNEDIGAENIERSVIPVERNVTIVNQTTNVTNITYNNTTIVNEGPNYDELRQRSRRPVERLRLQREFDIDQDQAPQATVRGNVLSIVTPLFSARVTERPRNLGAPIREVAVDRDGAASANQPDARRVREKMKSEATPPPDAPPKTFEKPVVVESTPPAPPTATMTPAPAPSASPTPRGGPRSTPTPVPETTPPPATPMPTPVATPVPPTATPSPEATATPEPTATPTPRATPIPVPASTPPPSVIDPPVKDPDVEHMGNPRHDRDGRPPGGGRSDRRASRDYGADADGREMSAARQAGEGSSGLRDAGRRDEISKTLPANVAEPAPAAPAAEKMMPPAAERAIEQARPVDQDGAAEQARPTPEGAHEP